MIVEQKEQLFHPITITLTDPIEAIILRGLVGCISRKDMERIHLESTGIVLYQKDESVLHGIQSLYNTLTHMLHGAGYTNLSDSTVYVNFDNED